MDSAELDSYMMDYHPYRGGTNPNHTTGSDSQTLSYAKQGLRDPYRKEAFYNKVKQWLQEEIAQIVGPVVLTIAPGHAATPTPTGFVHEIVGELLRELRRRQVVEDGRNHLIRTQTVPKQSQTPGARNEDTHRGTIEVNGGISNKNKTVIILDDVWTSGSTLRVCKEVMLSTNPKKIKLFAIGKTVQEEPPEDFF